MHPLPRHSAKVCRRLTELVIAVAFVTILTLAVTVLPAVSLVGQEDRSPTDPQDVQALTAQVAASSSDDIERSPATDAGAFSVADVARLANPAVVTVGNVQRVVDPFTRNASEASASRLGGVGSGFILDEVGHVVTNHHVVSGADELVVTFFDGRRVAATLIASDPTQDVAVLQLKLDAGATVPGVLSLGDVDEIESGETVVAIGTALGAYANTVTSGHIAAVERSLDTSAGDELANLVQHDATLWPGNSGGPLLNLNGEVIGMNVAAATTRSRATIDRQISFAIDSDAIADVLDRGGVEAA